MPYRVPWYNALRWEVINNRARGICEVCSLETATQVHHLVYPVGRREEARDLMATCDRCHRRLHHLPEAANDNDQIDLDIDDVA